MIHLSTGSQLLFLFDSLLCLFKVFSIETSHTLSLPRLYVHYLISDGTSVVFIWLPSHVGLADNSAVNIAAKAALLLPVSNLTVLNSDYKSLVRIQALAQWQLRWNSLNNKLHSIEPRVNVINMLRLPRRYEIIIHR